MQCRRLRTSNLSNRYNFGAGYNCFAYFLYTLLYLAFFHSAWSTALAKTHSLTSFGLCGWFLRDLAMCMAFSVGFSTTILIRSAFVLSSNVLLHLQFLNSLKLTQTNPLFFSFRSFFRSNSTEEVMPSPVLFSEINSSHIGMYVEIANVRFAAAEQGKPFVDPKDYYDTQRNMEACEGQNKVPFLLETSAFASF